MGLLIVVIVVVYQFDIVLKLCFDLMFDCVLMSFEWILIYCDELLNFEYNLVIGQMIDMCYCESDCGSGFLLFDIGCLLIWLCIVKEWYL